MNIDHIMKRNPRIRKEIRILIISEINEKKLIKSKFQFLHLICKINEKKAKIISFCLLNSTNFNNNNNLCHLII